MFWDFANDAPNIELNWYFKNLKPFPSPFFFFEIQYWKQIIFFILQFCICVVNHSWVVFFFKSIYGMFGLWLLLNANKLSFRPPSPVSERDMSCCTNIFGNIISDWCFYAKRSGIIIVISRLKVIFVTFNQWSTTVQPFWNRI